MRMSKTFTLDENIVRKIMEEPNQSLLINNLLVSYFKKKEFEGLSQEELKKEIKIMELQNKIEELRNGNPNRKSKK